VSQIDYFASSSEFRAWLEEHHEQARELRAGFHKKGSGVPSITWPQAVDEALCFGWIDGVRKGIDEIRYTIRFTPRKPGSTWSAINIKRVAELTGMGLMQAAGLKAFESRKEEKSGIYAYEQKQTVKFGSAYEKEFRTNGKAWTFFQAQPPWYRRTATWIVISAKREETRRKRLAMLIEESEQGRTIRRLTRSNVARESGDKA
jgi:uncharacterized protein YdeI (YjbR/CyaY-like superfamily)